MTTKATTAVWEVDCPPEYRFGMDGTKWRIFCCSVHYFAEYDYSSMSMRKIADEVGIKAASIYNHFPSKDAILEQLYDSLDQCLEASPTPERLLPLVEVEPPREVLYKTHQYFPPPLQELLSKMILVCSKMMRADPRADKLISAMLIDRPRVVITTLLQRMVEVGRIQPLDIDAFAELFINNYYGASQRMYSSHPVDDALWQHSFAMLFELVQPVDD